MNAKPITEGGLRSLDPAPALSTSTDNLVSAFYVPALSRCIRYDRGVGYFSSAWLGLVACGLSAMADRGGRARFIASPIMSADDCAALTAGEHARVDERLRESILPVVTDLATTLRADVLAGLAWMVADGLVDFRVAVPTGILDGDFHDKFGVFTDDHDERIAFHGSPNDSAQAFRNFESISVYCSWHGSREAARVDAKQAFFDRLWNNEDPNLRIYALPEAVRLKLVELTTLSSRPYRAPVAAAQDRWAHQREALAAFLAKRAGILEMATGTGKTRTALNILQELERRSLIDVAIVCAHGTDLLDQWHHQLVERSPWPVYRAYGDHREGARFLRHPEQSLLLCSRRELTDLLPRLASASRERALLVCDEVHGMGSPAMVRHLTGEIAPVGFRLGLSATPDREYDGVGNDFLEREFGEVIFRFGLVEAIQGGILCPFDYLPLNYSFSADDRLAVQQAFRRHAARKRAGEAVSDEGLYRDLARVRKRSREKLEPFARLIAVRPELLRRSIIFVEDVEYGLLVQELLMPLHLDYHTYYGDDDRANLRRFADDDLECLITCHRISEGIDISSLNNVILFSSSRAPLETVQRLGRCLRLDPSNPEKCALVVDFVRQEDGSDPQNPELDADAERAAWLLRLSRVRRLHVEADAILEPREGCT